METPDAMTDADLLRAWSARRCQPSFRALVEKYLGLVQGVALRRTGDAAQARDIAQTVFARLAAKAGRISAQPTLGPWLHHCAWCESTSALRRESTRTRHMKAYADHLRAAGESAGGSSLHDALPHLDAALHALPREDQRIVLMRFYEGQGLRAIAAALGKTEAAVRKQGQRALEKLALRLRRSGAGISTAALAAGLGAVLSQPSHAAAVTAISAGATATGAKLTLLDHVLTLMNTKTKTALVTAACMALPLVWQWQRTSELENKLAAADKDKRLLKGENSILRGESISFRAAKTPASAPDGTATAAGSAADWEAALKQPDPLQRMARLSALMASLTPGVAPDVAKLFKRLRDENGGNHQYETEHRQFLRAWGRLDGPAALASLQNAEGQPNDSGESLAALAGWAQRSPDKARAWLESLPPGDVPTALGLGLIDGWSLLDFDSAAAYAASLPRSTARDQFRSLLLQRALDSGGAPEAQRWFASIPDDGHNQLYKQRAFDELITSLMSRDPSAAAAWITRMGRQQFMNGDALPELAARLATSSPTEALRWLETMGPGEGEAAAKTNQGYASVLSTWSEKDPGAAGTWLQSQSSHPAYDQMAAVHSRHLANTDGQAALAWADSIADEAQRTAARNEAARVMLRSQKDSARGTLAAAGYTDAQMDSLSKARDAMALYTTKQRQAEEQLAVRQWLVAGTELAVTAEETFLDVSDAQGQLNEAVTNSFHGFSAISRDVSRDDDAYSRAHPNGAPANCAQCHQ